MQAPRRKKAYEEVAEAIRGQVLAGLLEQGQQLPPERELAENYGVSRVVVREAIRTLELAGILRVQKGAGGGTFVCRDLEKPLVTSLQNLLAGGDITLNDLFELRLLLEPPAAALAAQRGRPAEVARLAEAFKQAHESRDDPQALRTHNLEFHRRLVALAGNPLLSLICDTVLSILVDSLRGKLNQETSLTVHGFHSEIMEAVRQGRSEEARRLTTNDLATLRELYRHMGVEVGRGHAGRKVG